MWPCTFLSFSTNYFVSAGNKCYINPVSYTHLDVYKRQVLSMKCSVFYGRAHFERFQDIMRDYKSTEVCKDLNKFLNDSMKTL